MTALPRRPAPIAALAFAATALLAAVLALAQVAVPPLRARVTDLTATLDASQQASLEESLAALERRKGSQVAVLILPSTQPETIEQYAVRVEEQWKLGRKGVDDGVLLVVAKDDRRVRIEVGYGLEGALNDATAKRIIEEFITPEFRRSDYYAGIRAGTERIAKVIEGEPLPAPAAASDTTDRGDWPEYLIFGLAFVFIAGNILRSIFGRLAGAGLLGAASGTLVWFVAGSLTIALGIGALAFLAGLVGGTGLPANGRRGRGGWQGGFGGGDFGGGGFGGGGFGGGGGGSGGGGASGGW